MFARSSSIPRKTFQGMTLMEVLTVIAVMGVLLAIAAPSFLRTIEQAHADVAGANLETIWSAQRFFWLDNRTYADSLVTLEAAELLDATLLGGPRYAYRIVFADDGRFVAEAERVNSTGWSGTFQIDQRGEITGFVSGQGGTVVPGYQ